jgi:hypothetical protein
VISPDEAATWTRYNALRRACIMVDDFPHDFGRQPASEPVRVTPIQDALQRKSA